jgi:general stress protein 26
VTAFADLRADVSSIVSDSVYTTMTTVDQKGRPRSRALIVVWQLDLPEPVGWLGTFKTPIKSAHIANNPHVSTSYWSPRNDAAYLDSVAQWVEGAETAEAVWDMYRTGSPRGVGYDPNQFWTGPADPKFAVLRLDPWRIQVLPARDLVAGKPSRIWKG